MNVHVAATTMKQLKRMTSSHVTSRTGDVPAAERGTEAKGSKDSSRQTKTKMHAATKAMKTVTRPQDGRAWSSFTRAKAGTSTLCVVGLRVILLL